MDSPAKTIWIDCDPGADDALGILLLAASGIRIGGIVCCFGNGPSETTAVNAAKILKLANRTDIPVYTGASQPLKGSFTPSMLYCGEDGLLETNLEPDRSLLKDESYIDVLKQTFSQSDQKITWLVTGAMTNLANLLQTLPEAKDHITEVVTASGCFHLTEYASRAEWNIEMDTTAAKFIYESGIPIRAVGLDVTRQLQNSYIDQLLASVKNEKIYQFIANCTKYNREKGLRLSSLLNDAMAGSIILQSQIAVFRRGYANVWPEKKGTEMMSFREDPAGNVHAAEKYDFSAYLSLLIEKINNLE